MQQREIRDWSHLEDDLKTSRISFFEATTVFNIIGAWSMVETQLKEDESIQLRNMH